MATWLITGASSGLGAALARAVLENGDNAVITARNPAHLSDITAEYPKTALAVALEVADHDQVVAVVAAATERYGAVAEQRFGSIDVLVNNAVYGYTAAIEEGEDDSIERLFATNFFGPTTLIKTALPGMRAAGTGTIVNISFVGARITLPGGGYYSAAKAALEGLSGSLRKEVLCPETVTRRPGAIGSLRPRVLVPRGRGRLLFAVGATLAGTWALSGFYQAFSPVLAADELGTSNALIVALVFSSIVVLSPVGGLLTGRLRATSAMRIGLVAFVATTGAVLVALHLGLIGWFLAASAVADIAQGGANAGGMRAVLRDAAPGDRAGLLATFYLISYTGAAAPGLIAGALASSVPPERIVYGYGALVLVAAIIAITALRWAPRTNITRGSRTP